MKLTNDDVQEIIRLLDGTPYDELTLDTEDFRLVLRRSGGCAWTREQSVLSAAKLAGEPATPSAARPAAEDVSVAAGLAVVRAPLPGTFYRAPRPGAPPFVDLGSRVQPDTVIGIIETMKLMNPVPAGTAGEVVAVCLADASPAEQGSVLMHVRPATP